MHPLIDRILAQPEGICPAEINQYNAEILLGDASPTKREWGKHLLEEMSTICICETHKGL